MHFGLHFWHHYLFINCFIGTAQEAGHSPFGECPPFHLVVDFIQFVVMHDPVYGTAPEPDVVPVCGLIIGRLLDLDTGRVKTP